MKKTLSLLFQLDISTLSGCSSTTEAETGIENDTDKTLVFIRLTWRSYWRNNPSLREEKYGIKVDLVQASTGELFKKAEAEKTPVADVIFGGSYALFSSTITLSRILPQRKRPKLSLNIKIKPSSTPLIHLTSVSSLPIQLLQKTLKLKATMILLNPKLKENHYCWSK